MADRPKPKPSSNKARNDKRTNGKASKKGRAVGSRGIRLTELQKTLLGGGAYKRIERPAKEKTPA